MAFNTTLSPVVQKALNTAAFLHRDQKRKIDGIPFITHPVAVSFIVSRYYENDSFVAAALLHDVLEDVPTDSYSETRMRNDFGDEVTDLVLDVTEPDARGMTDEEERASWMTRKASYIDHLTRSDREGAIVIAVADKIHNLSCFLEEYAMHGDRIWRSFHAPVDKRLWVFGQVLNLAKVRLAGSPGAPLTIELENSFHRAHSVLRLDIA